ncbi:MAG: TIGR00730 family Rossman fold protein [Muribaculaceae bacterium]|nr:TIGR00730 family Rossman fold protein [Muribaculaceae bacterium]
MKDKDISDVSLKIAVYCSAAESLPETWVEAAAQLGCWIGNAGATLVYGGVDAGLMRVLARSVKLSGNGRIIGVVPMLRSDKASPLNDVEIPAEGLADRKVNMYLMSDVFVVLPGGYGTLDEMMSTLAYLNFNDIHGKKILVYNPDGVYDALISQFRKMIDFGLMQPRSLERLTVLDKMDDIIEILAEQKQLMTEHDQK